MIIECLRETLQYIRETIQYQRVSLPLIKTLLYSDVQAENMLKPA